MKCVLASITEALAKNLFFVRGLLMILTHLYHGVKTHYKSEIAIHVQM